MIQKIQTNNYMYKKHQLSKKTAEENKLSIIENNYAINNLM